MVDAGKRSERFLLCNSRDEDCNAMKQICYEG